MAPWFVEAGCAEYARKRDGLRLKPTTSIALLLCHQRSIVIGFAQPACSAFVKALPLFSQEGREWVSAVKLCLILHLEDHLKDARNCEDLWNIGFASHVPCYVQPSPNTSFCSLTVDDIVNLCAVVFNVLQSDSKGCAPTVKQSLQVFETCVKKSPILSGKFALVAARLGVKFQSWSTALSCLKSFNVSRFE
eukprot:m.133262 g.133262  ORF g.133262 m.133262 type:complete len:192 (+) comp38121_c0_seq7:282-857(+)